MLGTLASSKADACFLSVVWMKRWKIERWYVKLACHSSWDGVCNCVDVCIWQGPLCVCASHRRHVTSHLKWWGDSQSQVDTHTHSHTSDGLAQTRVQKVCLLLHVGSPWQNTTSAKKSNHISSRQKALWGHPATYHCFCQRDRARQNSSTELSFHTVTACCRLLDSIKTSQIYAHSCSVFLLQWKSDTAVLTQMYTKSQ